MSNKEDKNVGNAPATEVKQYTFGSEQAGRKKSPRKSKAKTEQTQNKPKKRTDSAQNKTKKQTEQPQNKNKNHPTNKPQANKQQTKPTYKKTKRKYKSRQKPALNIDVNVVKTAEDVRKDNARLEKEIILDIKEISRIEI